MAWPVAHERVSIMSALKILVIPGSLRTGSLNAKLAAAAAYRVRAGRR